MRRVRRIGEYHGCWAPPDFCDGIRWSREDTLPVYHLLPDRPVRLPQTFRCRPNGLKTTESGKVGAEFPRDIKNPTSKSESLASAEFGSAENGATLVSSRYTDICPPAFSSVSAFVGNSHRCRKLLRVSAGRTLLSSASHLHHDSPVGVGGRIGRGLPARLGLKRRICDGSAARPHGNR